MILSRNSLLVIYYEHVIPHTTIWIRANQYFVWYTILF